MNFIFPKNYNFKQKLLGIIDYSTAILDVSIAGILFLLTNFLFENMTIKIYFFVSLYFPILLFSIVGIHKESFINVLFYMIKFLKNQNIYLFRKETSKQLSNSQLMNTKFNPKIKKSKL